MYKKILNIICIGAILAGCARESEQFSGSDPNETLIPLKITASPEAAFSTSTTFEPMTKAGDGSGDYRTNIANYALVVMKWVGDKLIVDQLVTKSLTVGYGRENFCREGETDFEFELLLRPGIYNIALAVNGMTYVGQYIKPGMHVYDRNEDPSTALPLITYLSVENSYNGGHLDAMSLESEIYLGTVENLEVTKTTDLLNPAQPAPINIPLRNVTGKIRLMGKKDPGARESFGMDIKYHRVDYVIENKEADRDFVYGFNVLGKPVYNSPLSDYPDAGSRYLRFVTELYGSSGTLVSSYDQQEYCLPIYFGRASSFFYFADPDDTNPIAAEITQVDMTRETPGPRLVWMDDNFWAFEREPIRMGVKKISPLAFELTGRSQSTQSADLIQIRKLEDGSGHTVDASLLFGPYAECNVTN